MNNDRYLEALNKALYGLDQESRNNIIQEVQSHALESGDTLLNRFGLPEELALKYLEGAIVDRPLGARIWSFSKKLLMAIGVLVVAMSGLGLILLWWLRFDAFDYANEGAAELTDVSKVWVTEGWTGNLDIKSEQASIVFYWHDAMNVRYSCKGQLPSKPNVSSLMFSRGKCIVYLPKVPTSMTALQSLLVVVRPQQSLDIDLKQAELRVAENGTAYRYTFDASRTKVDDLLSMPEAELEMRIKAVESAISEYTY